MPCSSYDVMHEYEHNTIFSISPANALLIVDEYFPGIATATRDEKVSSPAPQIGPNMIRLGSVDTHVVVNA